MAAVATVTETIRLATCVAQIPLRNPRVLAHQAVTVDHISGGRPEVGLGTGLTIDPSLDMIGVPNWSNPERVGRDRSTLRRSANLFDALARGEAGRIRCYDDGDLFV